MCFKSIEKFKVFEICLNLRTVASVASIIRTAIVANKNANTNIKCREPQDFPREMLLLNQPRQLIADL